MNNDYKRPDPDALLHSINGDKDSSRRGKLKIFFGMIAGVGKTYSMLETAHRMIAEGKDVVTGYIETHRRAETEKLATGIETIPRKKINYKDMIIEEMDIDAVLARRPEYVLVDELAHTNAKGSRHAKRYQDVNELLNNGINVLTTLNVQHLESQADVVEKITGIKIREIIPDSVLDRADDIELVDLAPEDLLKRLAEGKVYMPEKAGLAAANFFTKSNIISLREMALHYTARLVGYELRDYTQRKNIRGPWKSGERLLVAVSPSPYSEYLIKWTRRIAFNLNAPWIALYVERQQPLTEQAKGFLTRNLNLARELGAEVISTADEDIVAGLLRITVEKNVTQIVVGKPLRRYLTDYFSGGNLVERLLKSSGDIEIHIVTQPHSNNKQTGFFKRILNSSKESLQDKQYITVTLLIALVTAINLLLAEYTGYWTIALIYLLSVVLLSLYLKRGPVLFSAAVTALLWNFLFIPPLFTFHIGRIEDALMFIMYFIITNIIAGLTSRLRSKELALRIREQRLTELYNFSRALGASFGIDEVISTAIVYIEDYFQSDISVLLTDGTGNLLKESHISSSYAMNEEQKGIAEWAFKNRKSAGMFTDTLSSKDTHYVPLIAPGTIVGVLGLRPRSQNADFAFEQQNFLQAVCYQLAMRLERENLSAANQKTFLVEESERLYKILLNTISHELRTPLTTITGASSSLLDSIDASHETHNALILEIKTASEKLNRLVENLLDMSRIESGRLALNADWNDISDIINTVLDRLETHLSGHQIKITCPDNIPLIFADYTLLAQAIYCIVHNAVVHTPPDTNIEISVAKAEQGITITVDDEGEGLPDENIQKVFEKFFRSDKMSHRGLGLGLTISKGIVELHGGSLTAENRKPIGARFVISFPVKVKDRRNEQV